MFRGIYPMFSRLCHFMCSVTPMILKHDQNNAKTIWSSFLEFGIGRKHFEQIPWNPIKNSVFSRLCPTSLIKFTMIFHFIYRQFGTILNSLEPFSTVLNKFRGILSKILCLSENMVT